MREPGQGLHQPFLGTALEFVEGQLKGVGDLAQQGAGDPAFVPFDEIEVARRDADASCQLGLRQADCAAGLADSGPDNGAVHGSNSL